MAEQKTVEDVQGDAQQPYDGPDRRSGDRRVDGPNRRTGADRRKMQGDTGDERRTGSDRRSAEDRRSGLDRRRGPGKRRSETRRAAEEGEMTEEQFAFIRAVQEYKAVNNKPFPTWTEVLDIIKALGYRKVAEPEQIR